MSEPYSYLSPEEASSAKVTNLRKYKLLYLILFQPDVKTDSDSSKDDKQDLSRNEFVIGSVDAPVPIYQNDPTAPEGEHWPFFTSLYTIIHLIY